MIVVIVIACVLVALFALFLLFKCLTARSFVKKSSIGENLIVFGCKGSGKSLMFSILARCSKYGYASNTEFYHPNGVLIDPKDISCAPNTWENVLNNDIQPIEVKPILEKKPIFLDDAGVYVPNFAEYFLKTKYPSMPISFALWRHFYDAPIHINSQDPNRTWKLLREQQSAFIRCKGVTKVGCFGFVHITYYDRISGAVAEVEPMKNSAFNKFSKAEVEKFRATYGIVKNYTVPFLFSHHKYDSRYFHERFFGSTYYTSNRKKSEKRKFNKDMEALQRALWRLERKPKYYSATYNN